MTDPLASSHQHVTRFLIGACKNEPLKPHDDRYDGTRIGTKDSTPAGHLLIQWSLQLQLHSCPRFLLEKLVLIKSSTCFNLPIQKWKFPIATWPWQLPISNHDWFFLQRQEKKENNRSFEPFAVSNKHEFLSRQFELFKCY